MTLDEWRREERRLHRNIARLASAYLMEPDDPANGSRDRLRDALAELRDHQARADKPWWAT